MKKYGLMLSLLSWSFCFAEVIYVNTPSEPMTSEQLYIDLMKRAVANTIYEDPDYLCFQANPTGPYDPSAREVGRSWPSVAHTMIGVKRLNNIQFCMEDILKNNIEGDVIETGVWRGGATILMRAILKAYGVTDRLVWVADSFEGLPPPNPEKHPSDAGLFLNQYTFLAVSVEQVKKNFEKYGLLDQQVVFLKGFFEHTLSKAPINKLAILRLDGDLYASTIDSLEALYDKVSIGGYIIVDDYFMPTCAKAINDFRSKHNITDPMIHIDEDSLYWKKTK